MTQPLLLMTAVKTPHKEVINCTSLNKTRRPLRHINYIVKGSFSVTGDVTGIKMACMLIMSFTSSVSSHLWEPEVHPSCFKNSSKSVVLFRQQDQNLYLTKEQKLHN